MMYSVRQLSSSISLMVVDQFWLITIHTVVES